MTAKVFGASEGYSVDHGGRHVFTYREEVPSWWGVRKSGRPTLALGLAGFLLGPRKEIPFAILGGIIGVFIGNTGLLILIGGAIGAFAGYHLGRVLSRNARAVSPLTGKADATGIVTDFQAQMEVDDHGAATLYRELHASDPKLARDYQPTRFTLPEVASIERHTWDEAFPDSNRSPATASGRKARAETRDLHKIIIVFRDGQSSEAGWKRGANAAARLQADLIAFFGDLSARLATRQAEQERAARIAPGDAPL